MVTLLALIFYFPALLSGRPVLADTGDLQQQIDAKNQEIQKLEAEIGQYQASIDEAESMAKTLSGEIKRLDTEVKSWRLRNWEWIFQIRRIP